MNLILSYLFTGFTISRVLNVLQDLDRHNFDVMEFDSSIDTLYNKVFDSAHIDKNTTYHDVRMERLKT